MQKYFMAISQITLHITEAVTSAVNQPPMTVKYIHMQTADKTQCECGSLVIYLMAVEANEFISVIIGDCLIKCCILSGI